MIIDKNDLLILRHLERAGLWLNPLPEQLKLPIEEIKIRIKKLEAEQIINTYNPIIFIPPFLGGDWVWGCVFINALKRENIVSQITEKIPFVSEIWFNSSLPTQLGHNISAAFYSKDFDTGVKFIKEIPDISYLEAYRISSFNYPLARIFSTEEKQLLKAVFTNPLSNPEQISEICGKNPLWIKTKLEKLVWTPQNPDGVIMILPEVHYRRIQNFSHCHLILDSTSKVSTLFDELKTFGFDIVLNGRSFQGKYIQIETDIWGFNDLIAKKTFLEQYEEIKIKGIIFAEEMRINSNWGLRLLED